MSSLSLGPNHQQAIEGVRKGADDASRIEDKVNPRP